MKRKIFLLAAALLSLSVTACANQTPPIDDDNQNQNGGDNNGDNNGDDTVTYTDTKIENFNLLNDEEVRYLGRYIKKEVNGKEAMYLGFTCTGFELFVDVKSDTNKLTLDLYSEMLGGNVTQYLKTYIDGKENTKIELQPGEQTVTLFENLTPGKHTLKLLKLNEASVSKLGLYALNTEGEVDYYHREYSSPRKKIEFYGDSLTCGYGNLGDPSIKIFRTQDEDGSLTYAQMLADKLDYDPTFVSCSGIALSEILAPYGVDMMDQYNTVEGTIPYDMSLCSPDIVVMNLGSNDHGGYLAEDITQEKRDAGIEEFINNYSIIMEPIFKNNPDCKVISVYNMCHSIDPALIKAIKQATKNLNEKYGEDSAFTIQLMNNQTGANGHPDLIGHRTSYDTIYKFIEKEGLNK